MIVLLTITVDSHGARVTFIRYVVLAENVIRAG
jgi:hypothetical protein